MDGNMNSVAGKRQRLLRRVFQHKSGSDETASPQKAPISPKSSNLPINGRKQKEIDLSLNLRLADSKQSDGPSLWTEVYNLFAASTASPDLQTVAKHLHDQSKALSSSTVNDRNRDTKASREWHLCREILHAAESKQSDLKKGSETPIMRQLKHACNEIIKWTQKFIALGDMISQVDPVHIGLPWAGIRAILVISIHNQKTQAEVLEGVANLSKLICRYAVFEEVYLHDRSSVQEPLKVKLADALKALYMVVFRYLVGVCVYFGRSSGARHLRSLALSENLKESYDDIKKHEEEVLRYESISIKAASHAQYMNVRGMLCLYEDHLQGEKRKQINDWISRIDYYSHHREMKAKVQSETGQWFLDRGEFRDWTASDQSSLLWLRGDAGTGKTSLISCVIEKILEQPWLDSKDALAYFYCSRTSSDTRQQDPRAILLSILRQLAAPLPGLPIKPPVISVYDRETTRGSQEAQLSIDEIAALLAELIHNHYESVTIVLDALDECDAKGRLYLLDTFTKLTYNPKTAVKTLFSSRNDPDIETHFSKIPNLFITATDNAGDIMRFISKELGQRLLRGKASTQIRARVENDLNKKANGVFRWVALQVDALCDPDRVYTEEDVEYLLLRLPKTLEDTYAVILHSLDDLPTPSREAIRNVLKLLICAEYPMSIHELLEALAILSESRQAAWERSQILKMAKGLITKESKKDLFVFSHLSVREFLEKRVEFSGENAHVVAAEACLKAYIRSNCSSIRCNNFRSYALTHLGRHCKKSGTLRQEPRLRSLLERFLLAEDSNDAFERWNRDCFHTDLETAPGTCMERNYCQSLPGTPLFMVCVYGFVEFVKPMIRGEDRVLYAENRHKYRPLEVAAKYKNYDVMELVYHAASSTDPSSIRAEKWLVAAAQSCNLDIWNFAVEHVPYVSLDRVLVEAANNPVHGKEMVSSLLNNITNIKHEVLEIVFGNCASFEILDIILAHSSSFRFTESILVAAAKNSSINPELTKMVLSNGQDLRVSEDCFLSAIYLSGMSVPSITAVFKALLNHPNRCKISEEMICKMARAVSSEGIEGLDLLIQHCSTDCITDDMLAAAVQNWNIRPYVLEFFLNHALGHTITQQVLQTAILNRPETYSRVTTLLSRAECPPVLEESLYIMTETWAHDSFVLPTVMERCEALYIGNFYLQACAANRSSQEVKHVTSLPRAISISKDTVRASLKNFIDAKCMLDLLLHLKFGFELEKSEDLLCEALSRGSDSLDLVRVLAKHWDSLPITERSMMVAVENSRGISTANYLLQHCKSVGEMLTENVLQAAIKGDNVEFVLFFKQRRPHFHVKEEFLLAAISEYSTNNAMLRILLSQQDRCPISKLVLETAAEKGTSSTLELLLQEPGVSSLLPETLDLANGNASSVDIDKETTFEAILSTASKEAMPGIYSSDLSTKALDLLLSKYNDPILDSGRLIEAAAERRDGKFVAQYLLSRFPETLITRRALLAAASNEVAMTSLFSLLLEHTCICIDSELLALAAGNKYRGTQMVELLLANWSADKKIERSVIIAALRNPYCGRSLFNLFLTKQPDFTIAQDVVDAASENEVLGKSILQMLLKQALTLSSMTLADLVFNKMKIIPDGLRDSLFIAVCYQENIILRFLISRGVSISTVSGELGTALNVAVYASNVNAVETLLDNGSDLNFCSKLYGTPLQSACQQRNLDIVRSLINHGAEIDLPNQMGRTELHRMLREGDYDVVNALISFGASTVIKDLQGMAAMHHACLCTNSADCINQLIELGAPVNQEDHQQWTPLHWAARSGAADTIIRLLEAGAEKTKTDASGKTPFQVAMLCGNIHLRSRLVLTDASDLDLELPGEEHPDCSCNACELGLPGSRHKCTQCDDFDLCFRCIADVKSIHDPEHTFEHLEI